MRRSTESMTRHVRLMVELQHRGAKTFDYGNNIRQRAADHGYADAFAFPGFVPAYIRPQFCRGRGPADNGGCHSLCPFTSHPVKAPLPMLVTLLGIT